MQVYNLKGEAFVVMCLWLLPVLIYLYFWVSLSQAEERHCEILGRLLYTAKLVAKQEGLEDGFRIVINDGPNGGQYISPSMHISHQI